MSETARHVAPLAGCAVMLRFDGTNHILYWGEDETGADRFASRGGLLMGWDSLSALEQSAVANGWSLDPVAEIDASKVVDLERIRRWTGGGVGAVDPEGALNLWNIATDVAYSLALPFRDRGHLASRCYDKLFAANVPWVFELNSYVPRWRPEEMRELRRILGAAIHVVRQGVSQRP